MELTRIVVFVACFHFVLGNTCTRVSGHLDCVGRRFITDIDSTVKVVLVGNALIPTELLRPELRHLIVVIRGQSNCFVVCSVASDKWIHSCLCQVNITRSYHQSYM